MQPGHVRAETVSVLPDGHVLIGGVAERVRGGEGRRGCDGELAVIRLDARGRVDPGFGDRGWARARPDGKDCVASVYRLAQTPDGHTLVGSTIFHPSDWGMEDNSVRIGGLTRLAPDGTVDPGFRALSPGQRFRAQISGFRFAVSPDGSIFDEHGRRYLSNGRDDPRDEDLNTVVGVAVDLAVDVAAQPDGKKLFLGLKERRNHRMLAVQRFDAEWHPDATFGTNGTVTADVAPGKRLDVSVHPRLQRVLPAPDGAVIAFGLAYELERTSTFAIKFDAAGRLDRSFGERGRIEFERASPIDEMSDLAVEADGSLIAIGRSGPERARGLFVARHTPSGMPDRRFGQDGRATIDLSRSLRNLDPRNRRRGNLQGAISPGTEGTIVGVASLTEPIGGDTVWSLAFRLHPDGTLDPSFGRRGMKVLSPLR
jgi:uncharacterized delta-60 repeat protein